MPANEPAWTRSAPAAYDIVTCWFPEARAPVREHPTHQGANRALHKGLRLSNDEAQVRQAKIVGGDWSLVSPKLLNLTNI